MTCVPFEIKASNGAEVVRGIYCVSHAYRLRLLDGRRVYMEWHRYLGPFFYHDRYLNRPIDDWFEDEAMCHAVDWFQDRGNKA